jgi:hypothetical protein
MQFDDNTAQGGLTATVPAKGCPGSPPPSHSSERLQRITVLHAHRSADAMMAAHCTADVLVPEELSEGFRCCAALMLRSVPPLVTQRLRQVGRLSGTLQKELTMLCLYCSAHGIGRYHTDQTVVTNHAYDG